MTDATKTIDQALDDIERTHSVTVIYACQSGSRAWRFASTDSDWDVRFIFTYARDRYLSINPPPEQIENMASSPIGELDIVGWDLRKALRLLRKSNPSLMEWVHSPIQYRSLDPHTSAWRSLVDRAFSPVASAYHYASMAHSNDGAVLVPELVVRKKYFYMLRTTLAYLWALDRRTVPPVLFEELLQAIMPPDSMVVSETLELLAEKRAGNELGVGPRLPHLHDFLSKHYDAMMASSAKLREMARTGPTCQRTLIWMRSFAR